MAMGPTPSHQLLAFANAVARANEGRYPNRGYVFYAYRHTLDAALAIGVSPHAFAMTAAIACSGAYVTPVSSPVNMLVMDPGGYTFMDFVKVGLPLLFLTMVVTVSMAASMYL